MEPITLGLSLVGVLGSAIWNVVADSAGHSVIDKMKHAWLRKFLRNDDIQRVVRESFQTALSMVEKEFFEREGAALSKDEKRAVEQAIKGLLAKVEQFFPKDPAACERVDAAAPGLLSPGPAAHEIAEMVLRNVGPVPASFRAILEVSFADAFVFSFKELGLKRDEKVRSVIYYEVMSDLKITAKNTEEGVRTLVDGLQRLESEQRFRARFESTATETLSSIDRGIARIETQVRKITEMLAMPAAAATAEAKGVIHVYGENGQELSKHSIGTNVVTIGRDPSNRIQLPHGSVSGRHAEIVAQGIHFVVRDLGSTNGTFASGARVKNKPIGFGDRVKIGPITISILEPQAAEDLMYPPTVPLPPS